MKIAPNQHAAQLEIEYQLMILSATYDGLFIDTGSYQGGKYDCLLIIDGNTGNTLFSIAY